MLGFASLNQTYLLGATGGWQTDIRPIASPRFPSNRELSTTRAISVVRYLISRGVDPTRLVAAAHGEFRPLTTGPDESSLQQNRRIELELSNR